jgi:hypothetical protein
MRVSLTDILLIVLLNTPVGVNQQPLPQMLAYLSTPHPVVPTVTLQRPKVDVMAGPALADDLVLVGACLVDIHVLLSCAYETYWFLGHLL